MQTSHFDPAAARSSLRRAAAILVPLALVVAARSIGRISGSDIPFNDEHLYWWPGVHLAEVGPPPASWGPLYSVWYWVESRLVSDPIQLTQVNWIALLFLNVLAGQVVARELGVGRITALSIAGIVGTLTLFDSAVADVAAFGSALVGFALVLALRQGEVVRGLAALATGLVIAAFVRPELALAATVATAFLVGVVARRRASPLPIAAPLLATVLLAAVFGNPLAGDRSFLALQQNFAANVVEAQHLDLAPYEEYGEITRAVFGTANSLGGAAASNPDALLWHVGRNAKAFHRLGDAFLPAARLPEVARRAIAVCLLILFGLGIGLAVRRAVRSWRKEGERPVLVPLAACALSVLAAFAAGAIVVRPQPHYLVPAIWPWVAVCVWGWADLGPAGGAWRRAGTWALPALACLLAAASVPAASPPTPRWNLETIEVLRHLDIDRSRHLTVLTGFEGLARYVGWDADAVMYTDCDPFVRCLASEPGLDVVVLDGGMNRHYIRLRDLTFAAFRASPERWGFRAFFPRGARPFYVREALLR